MTKYQKLIQTYISRLAKQILH